MQIYVASLTEQVEGGDMVEQLFKSPVWEKIISPWLGDEEKRADRRLRDFNHEIPQDIVGFGELGKIKEIEKFRMMLEKHLKQRDAAKEKLRKLQPDGDKNDWRK